MRKNTTALLLAAALGLAACGDEEEPAAARERADPMVAFAQCMREQGIDFPDPKPGGGPMVLGGPGKSTPEELERADKACAKLREAIKPPERSAEEEREFKDAALAHARCMREQGIDMPDPEFSADGGVQQRIERGANPDDADFRAALEACADTLPGELEEQP